MVPFHGALHWAGEKKTHASSWTLINTKQPTGRKSDPDISTVVTKRKGCTAGITVAKEGRETGCLRLRDLIVACICKSLCLINGPAPLAKLGSNYLGQVDVRCKVLVRQLLALRWTWIIFFYDCNADAWFQTFLHKKNRYKNTVSFFLHIRVITILQDLASQVRSRQMVNIKTLHITKWWLKLFFSQEQSLVLQKAWSLISLVSQHYATRGK